ncbi:MAG: DUF4065 domain-containing protein, partial [Planctomycetaceae bacterium]|nr:DUF4065 domain-containing protein [Planctomycetaceae bacterium]
FHETIFAWKHGPVVKDLYDKYKSFKGTPITDFPESAPELDDCAETVVKHVWEVYAACSDMQLSEITHRPNSPWRRFYNPYEWSYEVIQPMSIRDYFKSIKKQKNDTR